MQENFDQIQDNIYTDPVTGLLVDSPEEESQQQAQSDIGLYFDEESKCWVLNANIFARHLNEQYTLAVQADSRFYIFRDGFWQAISDMELKRVLYDYFNGLTDDGWNMGFENSYMASLIRIVPRCEDLISGESYVNLKNGLFCLNEWKLHPHNPKVFTPTRIELKYRADKKAKCPVFMAFLQDIFNNDESLISIVQELLGYCLSDNSNAHKFVLLYGRGRNGKSVLLDVIEALVGAENTSNITLSGFNRPFELANVVDMRVNISNENMSSSHINMDAIKAIAAGDRIQINAKFEKPFSHKATTKLLFAINKLPNTSDSTEGFVDRLVIIPFDKKYVDNPDPNNKLQGKRDPGLTDKLLAELDGIFVFALEGLRRLISNNYSFTESAKVTKLVNQFAATINPYLDFISTQLYAKEGEKIPRTEVYDTFKNWAKHQGFRDYANISARAFYEELSVQLRAKDIYVDKKKIRGTLHFKGIGLKRDVSSVSYTIGKRSTKKKAVGAKSVGNNVIQLEASKDE